MTDPWFKPKTYGYGASPANWKGWAAVLGFCVMVYGIAHVLIVAPSAHGEPSALQTGLFIALLILAVAVFIRVCRARTDGEWRWRWGRDGGDRL